MKARVWHWLGYPVEEYGTEVREFSAEEISAMSEKYDVMIHSVKTGRIKSPKVKGEKRYWIDTWDEVKIIFLDEKGMRCKCR
jgi:hypothetical protein